MTSKAMEHGKDDHPSEFNLKEWAAKARMVSRENTNSRRFSASYIRSFREDPTRSSFRSNVTISSTASSPGYMTLREEIDPSTYSFTTAIKALQARSGAYNWEYCSISSPDGFALNSKWNEAEKYICNPLSGQVPMECLSAKTLSGRSFRSLAAGRITMSAPLIYNNSNPQSRLVHSKSSHENDLLHFPIQEKKVGSMTRDVGTQSTPPELSSGSVSPETTTPPIEERSIKRGEVEDKVEVKETREKEETKREEEQQQQQVQGDQIKKGKQNIMCMCRCSQGGGCLLFSWKSLWMRKRQRNKQQLKTYKQESLYPPY